MLYTLHTSRASSSHSITDPASAVLVAKAVSRSQIRTVADEAWSDHPVEMTALSAPGQSSRPLKWSSLHHPTDQLNRLRSITSPRTGNEIDVADNPPWNVQRAAREGSKVQE